MPVRKVDPKTGFIEFIKTREERKLETLEKNQEQLTNMISALVDVLRQSNVEIPESLLKEGLSND